MKLQCLNDRYQDRDSIGLALIDGDGCIFTPEYWKQGKEGGRQAAAVLHQTLSAEAGRLPYLHTVIYFNRKGLGDTLCANGVCSRAEFEDFVIGFNQSAHLFTMIDVGQRKEAADAKIRGRLESRPQRTVEAHNSSRVQRCSDYLLTFRKRS